MKKISIIVIVVAALGVAAWALVGKLGEQKAETPPISVEMIDPPAESAEAVDAVKEGEEKPAEEKAEAKPKEKKK